MDLHRYIQLREDLVNAYNKIKYQPYECWIAPRSLMSLDDIRDRSNFSFEGAEPDTEYYERQEKRSLTIWKMVRNLNNFQTFDDISFQRPNTDIIDIYETLQTYIKNWCAIIRDVPEYAHIHIAELKTLENLAYVLFDRYRVVKPFVTGYKQRLENKRTADMDPETRGGLAGLALILARPSMLNPQANFRSDDDSFISHVDQLKAWMQGGLQEIGMTPPTQPYIRPIDIEDSIGNMTANESQPDGLLNWYKNRG